MKRLIKALMGVIVKPFVTIVIPNWNGKENILECLHSINNLNYPKNRLEVIVVDSGSTDGSPAAIKDKIKEMKIKTKLIEIKKNIGAPASYNIGIKMANSKSDYIFKLDNDVVLDKNCLKIMTSVADSSDEIGTCSAKQMKYYEKDKIDAAGTIIYNDCCPDCITDGIEIYKMREIPIAPGASALYKRQMLEDIKMNDEYFDSDYFIYQDEFDLSWRALLRGWKCVYVPDAIVYHKGSASIRTKHRTSKRAKYYLERNRIWTVVKNLHKELVFYCLPHMIIYELLSLPFYILNGYFFAVLKGRLDAIRNLDKMVKKRKLIQSKCSVPPEEILRWMKSRNYFKSLKENL